MEDKFREAVEIIEQERVKLGAVDGYDYNSGIEYGLRQAQIIMEKINDNKN